MAENPGNYRSSHNVSRHTVVMRRARDSDAQRVAKSDSDGTLVHQDPNNPSASLTARGSGTQFFGRTESGRTTTASGRIVVVDENNRRVSARLPGDRIDSVRVAGGDTIIKYKSGDMVIRRGTRRVRMRNQVIIGYAIGYFILFGLFAYHMWTGVTTVTPETFIEKAFKTRQGDTAADLARAAVESMRGNRTAAEVHMAQPLSFYDEFHEQVRVAAGDRLTLPTAAKLGNAVIEDLNKSPEQRIFKKPFKVYRETYLAGIDWPHILKVYNSIGFFLLAFLFLWRPIMQYLGTQSKKTAVALRNARDSRISAVESLQKYKDLDREIIERKEDLQNGIIERFAKERKQALLDAAKEARDISGGAQGAIENERAKQFAGIGAEMADKACEQARVILEKRVGQSEHDAAIDQLIADIRAFGVERAKAGIGAGS